MIGRRRVGVRRRRSVGGAESADVGAVVGQEAWEVRRQRGGSGGGGGVGSAGSDGAGVGSDDDGGVGGVGRGEIGRGEGRGGRTVGT